MLAFQSHSSETVPKSLAQSSAQSLAPTPTPAPGRGRPADASARTKTALSILEELMPFVRMTGVHACSASPCSFCAGPHLKKVLSTIEERRPIRFALPAFPGKSPNPQKVLGVLPDLGEQKALEFLLQLCQRIEHIYAPGAKIILCSDGRVFSDVVGMRESDVGAYQLELAKMLKRLSATAISIFSLENIYAGSDYAKMRADLLDRFGTPLEELKRKVIRGNSSSATSEDKEAIRMYRGITRFLFEDSIFPDQLESRSALQKKARLRAYEVIRRSNAWSECIAQMFPEALRLSIHPQLCGSKKLGIQLVGSQSWMTPWHGVAVETGHGYTLLRRAEAEQIGATLVRSADGRPSHYSAPQYFTVAARQVGV